MRKRHRQGQVVHRVVHRAPLRVLAYCNACGAGGVGVGDDLCEAQVRADRDLDTLPCRSQRPPLVRLREE